MSVPEAIIYRREFVKAHNVSVSYLKDCCTPESMSMGASAVFDVNVPGGRMAQRNTDGNIPGKRVQSNQITCPLNEVVDKYRLGNFDKFKSQSDERAKIAHNIMETVNQEHDYHFLNEIANATTTFNATPAGLTHEACTRWVASLAQQNVAISPDYVTAVISPMAEARLQNIPGYASQDYVSTRVLEDGGNQFSNQVQMKKWLNVKWIVHPLLPGAGTNSCTMYLWHKKSMGCAMPENQLNYSAGWNDEDKYYYASAALMLGYKILQQVGISKFIHNDNA